MAAHTEDLDAQFHYVSITGTGTAKGFDGPPDAKRFWVHVLTAAASVRAQVAAPGGTGVTDGTTNIATGADRGGTVPTGAWVAIPVSLNIAPALPSRGSLAGPTVYLQTDTNPTEIEYRWE